ncbi:MAG: hypothetical protein H6725_19130 [Sandaracinaceae bacterium]|nr:hypothetical protein [Sandaracinaceae bacterium]
MNMLRIPTLLLLGATLALPACSGGGGASPDASTDAMLTPDGGATDAANDEGLTDDAGTRCTSADECDDGEACTTDSCNAEGQCQHSSLDDDSSCDDGNACTQADTCQLGVCTGADPVVCTALDQCHDVGTCDPGTGVCSDPARDDDSSCDDGNACTQADTCQLGVCTGADPVVCVALDECHDVGICDPGTGVCPDPVADDGTTCMTTGVCTMGTCVFPPLVLARQDFEVSPAAPAWSYSGTADFQEGFSGSMAAPPDSPLGIGGSRAWHTVSVSGGQVLTFSNVTVPAGFVRVRLRFRLAAMSLTSASGGPDDLDYVLVELSTDGGMTYYSRVRLRGSVNNNSFWGYEGTGVALVDSLPMVEALFQRTPTGYLADGYSTVEVVFPADVGQVGIRLTARSSSSTDSWLIDDVELIGEYE